jgi:hypothetical protein
MINVGFDMDGVLQDSQVIFKTLLFKKYKTYDMDGFDGKGNMRFAYFIDGVSSHDIWLVILEALTLYQPFMTPLDGMGKAVYKVWELQNKKPIQIITARPEEVRTETIDWLDQHFPVPYVLHIQPPPMNDVNKTDKSEIINGLGLTHFVEDRFRNCTEIANGSPCIEKLFLLNKPYNRGRRIGGKVERIDWLSEIHKILGG